MKKWKYEVIIVAVLLVVGLGVWWFVATKDERATKADTELMIKFAQRQALEIAIIEQTSKLTDYKRQIAQIQQQKKQVLEQAVQNPIIAEDVNDSR